MNGKASLLASTMILAIWSIPAAAQTADPTTDAGLDEVVVTAQRTASTVQKTPLALTVIGGEELLRQGVKDASDLTNKIPNVNIANNVGTMTVNIRGVGTNADNQTAEPAVNINVDGVYLARATSAAGAFFDVERIEALRGPQGTLYGRNSTGGSLNIITNKPVHEFEGRAEIEVGNFNQLRTFGMLNVPVVEDKLAIRVAFQSEKREGYTDNAPVRNYNDADSAAARIHALFTPNDDISLLLSADYGHYGGVGSNHLTTPDAHNGFKIPMDTEGRRDTPLYGASATFRWALDAVELTYVGAYRAFHRYQLFDNDFKLTASPRDAYAQHDWKNSNWSHELRLASRPGSAFRWVVGGFYYSEDNDYAYTSFNSSPTTNSTCFCIPDATAKSYAVFGQGTYPLTDALSFTAGLRYTHDRKAENGQTIITRVAGPPVITINIADLKFNDTSGKVGFEWTVAPSNLLYVTASNGYKAGGYYDGLDNRYEPEKLTAYEFGSKNRFLDNRLQVNIAGFYYDYKNFQANYQTTLPDGARIVATGNARKARSYGLEAETTFRAWRDGRLDLNISYLNARFIDFVLNDDYTGFRMPRAPRWTIAGGYSHSFHFDSGAKLVAGVRSYFQSGTFLMFQQLPGSCQSSYTRTDLDLTFTSADERWTLGAYVQNLEDSVIASNAVAGPGSIAALDLRPPRMYGLRLGARF